MDPGPMSTTADVVIVGGGLEGAASAWALSQRGITDVVVAERNTVGSGMTGKSSGIVRCHYGVSSLAAMATVGLEVFEKAEEIFGDDIGFRQTGYVVGVGEPNVESLRKSLAAQRAVGVQTEEIERSEVARMWPFADLEPFAAFGWEARGGYGDAYQTAQAFAVAARGAGVRVRQGCEVAGLLLAGDKVTGVRLTDGSEVSAGTVVVATGVWTKPFLEPYGIDVPIRVVREQIVMINPGVKIGPVPRRASAGTDSRSHRRSAGSSRTSSSTGEAPTRGFPNPISGCPGSPRTTRSRARIRMSAPARCDDSGRET
jgi:sarcosine oxidase subunit beta